MNDPLQSLPHGPEFRFLSRLSRLDPGKSGEAEYDASSAGTLTQGHFPGNPMLPGVILIEAAAQLAGVVAQSDATIPPLKNLRLTAVRNARITGTAFPGQILRLEATIEKRLGGLIMASAKAWVEATLVLTTEVTLSGEV